MSDNFEISEGSGLFVRSDEIDNKHLQVIKIGLGPDGTEQGFLQAGQQTQTNSLSVCLANDQNFVDSDEDIDSVESEARTVSGYSDDIDVADYKEATFYLNVSAVTHGTILNVKITKKDPISGGYFDKFDFDTAIGVSKQMAELDKLGNTIRIEWTISGTSVTFSVGMDFKS